MNHDVAINKHCSQVDEGAEQEFTSEDGHVAREPVAASALSDGSERASLMSEFSIRYDGRHYRYGDYRHDRLADATDYARLVRSRSPTEHDAQSSESARAVEAPDTLDRQVMARLCISFEAGMYEFEGFHYERLADAVSYAQLRRHIDASERAQLERK